MPDDARAALRQHFRSAAVDVFGSSPLYRAFCAAAVGDDDVLDLLARRRAGQQPSYLLFGAMHYLVLRGLDHPVADLYAAARSGTSPAAASGAVFRDAVRARHDELGELIGSRLVQSNVVRRAAGLRLALAAIGRDEPGPVHLIEVGASAGVHLFVDRYRFRYGERTVGPPDAPVTIATELRGTVDVDLDAMPAIATRTGIDLHPVDVRDPDQLLWLRALVWPENGADAALLDQALDVTRSERAAMLTGDAIDVCPALADELPAGQPRVVFHAATRMHVPRDRWAAFDAAIDTLGDTGPLFHVWQESPEVTHGGGPPLDERAGLFVHGPDGVVVALAAIDGHGAWIEPLRTGRTAPGH